jgi:hypothetical protein
MLVVDVDEAKASSLDDTSGCRAVRLEQVHKTRLGRRVGKVPYVK